jgi:hypothetical protein
MMKVIVGLMLVSILMVVTAPAYSGGSAVQMWKCEMDDDASEQDIKDRAAKWLKAAKSMKGGKNLEAYVYFPVAVNNMGETDLIFTVVAPSFAEWGMFWDSYAGSAAAAADKNNKLVDCPDSAVWESFQVK